MQIEGRSALITGGSQGLGAALGRALAQEGARVVLVARGGGQLFQRDLEGERDLVEHGQGGVGAARLQVSPGGARHRGEPGHLLLGHAARLAELADVGGQAHGQRIAHSQRIELRQYVGNFGHPMAEGP